MRDTIKLYLHDFEVQIRSELDYRVKEVASQSLGSSGEKASGGKVEVVKKTRERGGEVEEAVKEAREKVEGMEAKVA